MSLLNALFLFIILYSQSGMSINSTMINKLVAETAAGSHSALDLMLCSKEVASNITCPAGKYATSKCVCATCLDFGDACVVDSQCCQSSHMSCWKFAGLSGAHCLCDDSYSWDAYTATCFMPANLPQQMLMITLYSFISMFVFVGVLFTLAHVCNFSICAKIKPRNNNFEAGDLHFLQEPETRSNRDMPPSYSQIFPEFCPQDAMVNAGLDLALPLYSQALAREQHSRQAEDVQIEIERQIIPTSHQFTLQQNQIQIEPPPAYEETDLSQITASYQLHPIALPDTNEISQDTSTPLQVPTIIITPSENQQDNQTQFTDDPDSDTPPAALLQVPNRCELESVNIESPPTMTSTLSVELYKPIFVSTMNIILDNPSFYPEEETMENTHERHFEYNLNTDSSSNDSYSQEYLQHNKLQYSEYYDYFPESDIKHDYDPQNERCIESRYDTRELISKKFDMPILPTILEEPISTEVTQDNSSIHFFHEDKLKYSKRLNVENDISEITSTSENEECCSLQEEHKNEYDIPNSLGHKLFKFDYTKFCNFERSMKEGRKHGSFQPSVEEDSSSYTSPACHM